MKYILIVALYLFVGTLLGNISYRLQRKDKIFKQIQQKGLPPEIGIGFYALFFPIGIVGDLMTLSAWGIKRVKDSRNRVPVKRGKGLK